MKKNYSIQRSSSQVLKFCSKARGVVGLITLLFSAEISFAQNPLVKQWDYRYGGSEFEWLSSLQQTSDGGYILGGYTLSDISGDKTQASQGAFDYWIVKTDAFGLKQWDVRFGGNSYEFLESLQQTSDGGYILGGCSTSGVSGDKTQGCHGSDDYWIVKTDVSGIKQWDARFGGNDEDYLFSLQQTSDGGYILGGFSCSGISGEKTQACHGYYDYWIVKTDADGVKQWDATFGGSNRDEFHSLQQTSDGGYILGGRSLSGISGDKTQASQGSWDYWIVKIDSGGVKLWDARYGGSSWDELYSLQQTSDGGYILGGYSHSGISGDKTQASQGGYDYWIVKTDASGVKQWDARFGGSDDDEVLYGSVEQTNDEGYFIAGTSYSDSSGDKSEDNLGPKQLWIVKTDSIGNKLWDKTLLTNSDVHTGLAIQADDGCFVMAGWTHAGIGGDKTQDCWGDDDYWFTKWCDTTPVLSLIAYDNRLCEKFCTNFQDQSINVNATSWQWQFPGGDPSSSTDQNPTNICYDVPGIYDVTLITTNAFGNDTLTLSNYITVYSTPPFPTITQNGYMLTSSPALSYQWQFNTIDIPGATNQSYNVLQTGLYTVIISDSNGCVNSVTQYVLISGISDQLIDDNIFIDPNPSDGNFLLVITDVTQRKFQIQIFNAIGQNIFSENASTSSSSPQKEIHLTAPGGIYLIAVSAGEKIWRKKIVIDAQ